MLKLAWQRYSLPCKHFGSVAQLVEQKPLKLLVLGSSPSWPTMLLMISPAPDAGWSWVLRLRRTSWPTISMKLLFLGDIIGRPGRKIVKQILPDLVKTKGIDFVIANGENMAGGIGINRKVMNELLSVGVHLFTGGNHSFENESGLELFSDPAAPVLRPGNLPEGTQGRGWTIRTSTTGKRLLVINLLGRVFMSQQVSCPFRTADRILQSVDRSSYDACFIDFHAEATGEKQALRWYLDGRVSALVGSHTHVQTNDADISPSATAFMADAGMSGSLDSCLGVEKELVIKKSLTQLPVTYKVERYGRMQFNAVLIEIDDEGKAKTIEALREILSIKS